MRKYIPYIVISVFAIIIVICIICVNFNKTDCYLLSYKTNYNVTTDNNEDCYLNINLYINNNKSYIVDKNQIMNCYISDSNNSSIINLQISSIKQNDLHLTYKNNKYNCYNFKFKILFDSYDHFEWYIEDAILNVNYKGNKEYNVKIGNFSFVRIDNINDDIIISNIKPLLSSVNDNSYMSGLILGVRKNSNYNVNIESIKILNCNTYVGEKVQIIDNLPEGNDFNKIYGYDYSNLIKGSGEVNINIIDDNVYYLLIPIYYEKLLLVNNFAIEFCLIINGEEIKYYLNNYTYYQPNNEIIKEEDIFIYNEQ